MIARFPQVGTIVGAPRAWNHGRVSVDSGAWTMIEDGFDARTLANMNVALERVCRQRTNGEDYNVRKLVAEGIIQCAKEGRKTLGALTQAGERVLTELLMTKAG